MWSGHLCKYKYSKRELPAILTKLPRQKLRVRMLSAGRQITPPRLPTDPPNAGHAASDGGETEDAAVHRPGARQRHQRLKTSSSSASENVIVCAWNRQCLKMSAIQWKSNVSHACLKQPSMCEDSVTRLCESIHEFCIFICEDSRARGVRGSVDGPPGRLCAESLTVSRPTDRAALIRVVTDYFLHEQQKINFRTDIFNK